MRLIGRERELDRAARFLDRARAERVARILRITGNSGNGKTSLIREIRERATEKGWLSVYVAAHRIQSGLPLVLARRLSEEIVKSLADEGARYASGLEGALGGADADPKGFESALSRLAEGVLHDRALLLVIDDVQWSDAESASLLPRIVQSFADKPIVLVLAERADEAGSIASEAADETILVSELNPARSAEMARMLMPDASNDVVDAVVSYARGRPVDIATIASLSGDPEELTLDDIAASARAMVARDVAALRAPLREFLQICSLIGEPIEYDVLAALWPDEVLLGYISEVSGRYIVQDEGLRFVHATVEQSIRETIPIEIPYRKRIIAAIEQLPSLTPARYEQLVEQAAACGDRALEKKYLLQLTEEATKAGAHAIAGGALERIITLTPFSAEAIPLYARLSIIYNMLSRIDTIRVCREALERASVVGIREGLGQIVASLLFSLIHNSDRAEFERALQRYEAQLTAPADRAHVLGVRMYVAMCDNDEEALEAHRRAIESLGIEDPMFDVRYHSFRGGLAGRRGRIAEAVEALDTGRATSEERGLRHASVMLDNAEAIVLLHTSGLAEPRVHAAVSRLDTFEPLRATIEALERFATGAPDEAMQHLSEAFVLEPQPFARRVLLGLAGSVSVLGNVELSPHVRQEIEREAEAALRTGIAPSYVPLLSAAAMFSEDGEKAVAYGRRAAEIASRHFEPQVLWLPPVLALAAGKRASGEVLRMFVEGRIARDQFPWNAALHDFARLVALRALRKDVSALDVERVAREFRGLGADYFAQQVETRLAVRVQSGITEAAKPAKSPLTRREREVAEMIAGGNSNRDIAEKLVLSERTIEGHVANIFAKLNVGSRAQIAVWYVASAAPAAVS